MTTATPMRYNGPGWTIESPPRVITDPEDGTEYESCDTFQLWAPNEKRTEWSACWTPTADNLNPGDGFFVRGGTLDDVLAPFRRPELEQYGQALRAAAEADQVRHLVLCCRCEHMRPADEMIDRPEGWTCASCAATESWSPT